MLMSESRFYHITPEGKLILLESLDEALSATGSGGFIWLDYFRPTREELSLLIDPLGLHPLSVEDCFDENQIPKIDDYPGNAFLLFNTFSISQGVLTIGEADMFIGTDFLVTINSIDPGNRQIAGSIEQAQPAMGATSDWNSTHNTDIPNGVTTWTTNIQILGVVVLIISISVAMYYLKGMA